MDVAVVSVNKNVQGGTPCFAGTRVPITSLFDYPEGGHTVDFFVSQFPSVKRGQATALLEQAKVAFAAKRQKHTEEKLLKGVTPATCRPDHIPDRRGREIV